MTITRKTSNIEAKRLIALFSAIILLATTSVTMANAEDVDDLVRQCKQAVREGKYEHAIFHCGQALKIDPNNLNALRDTAFAYFSLGRYEHAMFYYDKLLEIDPKDVDALGFKGVGLFVLGRYEEAISYFDRILQIDPNDVFALKSKGMGLHFLGKYDESVLHFNKVMGINPNDADMLYMKGSALAKDKRITDRGGRVFAFGILNAAKYDHQSPSVKQAVTLPGSLKIFAEALDNVGVKDVSVIAGKTILPMKRYQGDRNWWVGSIPSSDLPTAGTAIPFKIVVRDYNNNIGVYSGWAQVPCEAFGKNVVCQP